MDSNRPTVGTGSCCRDTAEQTSSHSDPSTVSTCHHQTDSTTREKTSPVEEGVGEKCNLSLREEECGPTGFLEDASLSNLKQSHSDKSRSSSEVVLQLEGITEKETSTDCSSQYQLKETWETLKQLGEFLSKVGNKPDQELSQIWAANELKKGLMAQDLEDKMSSALVKRSASLAKLGILELSAHDMELSPASSSLCTNKPHPNSFNDDTSIKKRVLPRRTPSLPPSIMSRPTFTGTRLDKRLVSLTTDEAEHSHRAPMPLPVSPLSEECLRRGKVQDPAFTPVPAPALISVATREQYGKTHPLTRLKNRPVNSTYNTV